MTAEDIFESLGATLEQSDNATISSMFGKRSIFVNGKACIALFDECLVFKLPKTQVEELLETYEGSQKWDPSGKGRAMKEWLQVPTDHCDDFESLATTSCAFVSN